MTSILLEFDRPREPSCVGLESTAEMIEPSKPSFCMPDLHRQPVTGNAEIHRWNVTNLTLLLSIADAAARAMVPPNNLKKFLVPVATAISFRLTAA